MNEEAIRILKMVEEGKLNSDKAEELLDALSNTNCKLVTPKNYEDKFLKIKILSKKGDKVNVQLPVKVIKGIIKATGKLPVCAEGMDGINVDEIMNTVISCLDNEIIGEIVDIESAEGDIVKIVIE